MKKIACIGIIVCILVLIRLIHYVLGSYIVDAIFLLAFLWPLVNSGKILYSELKKK